MLILIISIVPYLLYNFVWSINDKLNLLRCHNCHLSKNIFNSTCVKYENSSYKKSQIDLYLLNHCGYLKPIPLDWDREINAVVTPIEKKVGVAPLNF